MSTRFTRRSVLAGMAALPALALVGCESDRTIADPISTVDTLDFANRLRIPALAAFSVAEDGVRVFRLSAVAGTANSSPARQRRPGATPTAQTTLVTSAPPCGRRGANASGSWWRTGCRKPPLCTGTVCICQPGMTAARTSRSALESNGSLNG
jgi:hypothetical protein